MNIRDLFYLRRSDRVVIFLFLVIGVVALGLMLLFDEQQTTDLASGNDSVKTTAYKKGGYQGTSAGKQEIIYDEGGGNTVELFPFDPNTADSTALLRLGLSQWQVRSVYRYRAKGGIYRRPIDFARLPGLTKKQFRELEPYIRISDDYAPAAELYTPPATHARDTARHYPHKLKPTERIELNASDTAALKRVPGIGSYYARQIVNYRERLGGFYAKEQLREIEGFPEEVLPYIIIGGTTRKLNVNKLSLSELRRHPYINYYQARAIIDYRRLKGNLKSLDELRLLKDFTARDLERLKHYVEY